MRVASVSMYGYSTMCYLLIVADVLTYIVFSFVWNVFSVKSHTGANYPLLFHVCLMYSTVDGTRGRCYTLLLLVPSAVAFFSLFK